MIDYINKLSSSSYNQIQESLCNLLYYLFKSYILHI